MLKNISRLESIVNGKTGHLYLDSDTPLVIVKEMLFQFQKYIGQIEDNAKAQQEAEKPNVEDEQLENIGL